MRPRQHSLPSCPCIPNDIQHCHARKSRRSAGRSDSLDQTTSTVSAIRHLMLHTSAREPERPVSRYARADYQSRCLSHRTESTQTRPLASSFAQQNQIVRIIVRPSCILLVDMYSFVQALAKDSRMRRTVNTGTSSQYKITHMNRAGPRSKMLYSARSGLIIRPHT
jgi:hypothetical protein